MLTVTPKGGGEGCIPPFKRKPADPRPGACSDVVDGGKENKSVPAPSHELGLADCRWGWRGQVVLAAVGGLGNSIPEPPAPQAALLREVHTRGGCVQRSETH